MPTYEYRCPKGHVTELVQSMADDKPESFVCAGEGDTDVGASRPICGERATRVFHSPIAVHFDGTGGSYYEDVYRNDSGRYGWKRRANAGDDLPVANL